MFVQFRVYVVSFWFNIDSKPPSERIKPSSLQRLAPALTPRPRCASPAMSRRSSLPFFALLAIAALAPCFVGSGNGSGNATSALREPRQAAPQTAQSVALVQVTKEKLGSRWWTAQTKSALQTIKLYYVVSCIYYTTTTVHDFGTRRAASGCGYLK